jgi:replicative DNA helicase
LVGDITLERPLPHSPDSERAILGAVLVQNEALNAALETLTPTDFFLEGHRWIFDAMVVLSEHGAAIDPITLAEELGRRGKLDEAGGRGYIASLLDGVPVGLNVERHATIVKEKSTLRALITSANRTIHAAISQGEPTEEILESAQRNLFEICQGSLRGGFMGVGEVLDSSLLQLDRLQEGALTGLPTGYLLLDELTSGFQPGDLVILAARPGLGKTSLALNIAQNVALAEEPKHVGVFSLEMTKEQLAMRLICAEARVDHHRLRRGYLSERDWKKVTGALGRLGGAPIYIDDTAGITPLEMRAKSRRLKAERGLDLLILDYIQLMHVKGYESRTLEISAISRALKEMAKELKIPVLALSQLSRAIETRGEESKPRLSDLRESGSLEQDSDVVLFINRKPPHLATSDEKGLAEIIIAKQRNGPVGKLELAFLEPYTRFETLAGREEETFP